MKKHKERKPAFLSFGLQQELNGEGKSVRHLYFNKKSAGKKTEGKMGIFKEIFFFFLLKGQIFIEKRNNKK